MWKFHELVNFYFKLHLFLPTQPTLKKEEKRRKKKKKEEEKEKMAFSLVLDFVVNSISVKLRKLEKYFLGFLVEVFVKVFR